MGIGVGRARAARESAEAAADETDIREIDVAVDDVGDRVTDGFAPHLISGSNQGLQCRAGYRRKPQGLLERKFGPFSRDRKKLVDFGRAGIGRRLRVDLRGALRHRRVVEGGSDVRLRFQPRMYPIRAPRGSPSPSRTNSSPTRGEWQTARLTKHSHEALYSEGSHCSISMNT